MGRARSWTVNRSMGWGRDRGVGEKRKQLSVKNLCSKVKFKKEERKSYQTYSFALYILSLENLLAVAQTCPSVFCLHILFMLFLTEISSLCLPVKIYSTRLSPSALASLKPFS